MRSFIDMVVRMGGIFYIDDRFGVCGAGMDDCDGFFQRRLIYIKVN